MTRDVGIWSLPSTNRPKPSAAVTALIVLALVASWLFVYLIGLLGAIWRFKEPNAPAPDLTTSDQWLDLAVGAAQILVGALAIGAVYAVRRRHLPSVWAPRPGSARDAAIRWCAAIGASSIVVMVLSGLGIARFSFTAPAVVESDWLAVLSALVVGLREEPILVALPVLLLVGRVPIGLIMALSATMRGMLYLYFGGGGFVWAFIWGAAAVWVYYRYRKLWVLIAIHGFVMNIQVLDRIIPSENAATILQWINILVLFGALLWWLTPRALDAFVQNTVTPVREVTPVIEMTPVVPAVLPVVVLGSDPLRNPSGTS